MPWIRIDDQFPDHPKIAEVGPLAAWLYVCGLCYSGRMLTDGYIPQGQLRKLADIDDIPPLVTALLQVGLWETCDGGYRIHDYHEYQPSAEKIRAERKANAERQARFREKTSKTHEPPRDNVEAHGICNDDSNTVTNEGVTAPPYPFPFPKDVVTTPTVSTQRAVAEIPDEVNQDFEEPYAIVTAFFEEIPGHKKPAPAFKNKQFGIAKRLSEQGYTANQIRRCIRFMRSESWRTKPFDLGGVESYIGTWEQWGEPEIEAAPRASPRKRTDPNEGTAEFMSLLRQQERNHA